MGKIGQMCKNSNHKFKRTFSRRGPTISKWCVIHLRVQYVDETLIFWWDFIFRWLRRSKVNFTWFGVLFGFLSQWYGGLEFVFSDLEFNRMHFSFHVRFWNWHVIYWWWSSRLENVCLTRPNREVTFASFWFTMYGFAPFKFAVYSFAPFNLPEL